jgi:hypothetical protein
MAKSFLFDDSGKSIPVSVDRVGLVTDVGGLSYPGFSCAITSPAAGAGLTQGTPVTITGLVFGAVVLLQVKLGPTVLGAASIVGNTWSYVYTPQAGDVGAQTINATATNSVGAQRNAPAWPSRLHLRALTTPR